MVGLMLEDAPITVSVSVSVDVLGAAVVEVVVVVVVAAAVVVESGRVDSFGASGEMSGLKISLTDSKGGLGLKDCRYGV